MKSHRVLAIFKRHAYATLHSPPILVDMVLWPVVDLLVWGLLTVFIRDQHVALPLPIGFLVGGVLLWDLLFRSNLGIAIAFLDDAAWSRNAVNLLVAPLRPVEYLAGATLWSLVRIVAGWSLMVGLAWLLFEFSIFRLGPVLAVLSLGLILFGVVLVLLLLGLVLRFGQSADILAWGLAMAVSPLCAVYYPLHVLPEWAQSIALALPPAHVFEAMRSVLAGRAVEWSTLMLALALDFLYLALAFAFARAMYGALRRRGFVTRYM